MRILLALLAIAGSASAAGTCDPKVFNKCSVDLASRLGIPTDGSVANAIFYDYTILNNALLKKFSVQNGVDTILASCNAMTAFYSCMTGNEWCYSLEGLLKRNSDIDKESAFAIRGTLDEYDFKCGAGLGTILRGDVSCVQQAIDSSMTTLQGCTATYLANVRHDANRACKHAGVLQLCYMAPFHLAQCRKEEALDTWWACTSQRRFVSQQFPNCMEEIKCKEKPLGLEAFIADHVTVKEDGSSVLRLPDRVSRRGEERHTKKGEEVVFSRPGEDKSL